MSKIRPEQMGHKALLRRGRSTKWMQYTLLAVAGSGAAVACVVALSTTL
ncbi:hypothetical protein RCH16_002300 [Cryobacterium sp. MP_M5]|nr:MULTISPECIES: hypothetical protein [unclassified Cryobacterium]MBG6058651.1 hypothetical protein [Cryobacterium sp. MP_M3]MEC5177289.1 hypothetical protein [Cryobacterium sp. MP_M5]